MEKMHACGQVLEVEAFVRRFAVLLGVSSIIDHTKTNLLTFDSIGRRIM